jgi:aminoglycoside phosphotransferase (APT) family kinase protein
LLWQVIDVSGQYALRLLRAEQTAVWPQELTAMRQAAAGQIPVPILHKTMLWQERPVILMSWCEGETVAARLLAAPWLVWRLGKAMGEMQARLHQVDFLLEAGQTSAGWIDWKGPCDPAVKQRLLAQLPPAPTLLHLDFHLHNVLTDGKRITAVLDWTNARPGDPRADLARTYAILRIDPWDGRSSWAQQLFRRLLSAAWRSGYTTGKGPIGDLALYLAWAGGAMQRDLAPRLQRPDAWLRQSHLDAIGRWTAKQKRAAGLEA